MLKIGIRTAVALGEAASKYEGYYREDEENICMSFRSSGDNSISHSIPKVFLPKTEAMRDKYVAYMIRQMVTMLDDKVIQFEALASGGVPCLK